MRYRSAERGERAAGVAGLALIDRGYRAAVMFRLKSCNLLRMGLVIGLSGLLSWPAMAADAETAAAIALCDKEVGTPLSGVPGVPDIYFDVLMDRSGV
eukprot:gene43137-57391_t